MVIGIVMIVPVSAGRPGIVPVHTVVITEIIAAAIIIPVVEFRPLRTVTYFHAQVAVIIIFIAALVAAVIFFLLLHILFSLGPGRGKIYIIGCLTGFV
jgi:hypothetical protein